MKKVGWYRLVTFYALLDPRTNRSMYVGQTMVGFKRLRSHLAAASVKNPVLRVSRWIKSLKKLGRRPKFKVLKTAYTQIGTGQDEIEIIEKHRLKNPDLLNHQHKCFCPVCGKLGPPKRIKKMMRKLAPLPMGRPPLTTRARFRLA